MSGFRPLLLFWACILGGLLAGAAALQLMGPPGARLASQPRTPVLPQAAPAPAHAAASLPARLPASTPNPAPEARLALSAIPDPDPALQEPAPDLPGRLLPRSNGARQPSVLYAAAFDPAERHPRVTLVISGAGLDRALTAQADHVLPAAIDFAFSAYTPAPDGLRLAAQARRAGRECLVSIPMEPNGFPANEEGNRALLTGASPDLLRTNLEWSLSGVPGCVGATDASDGLYGERFAESRAIFADMQHEVAQRGLLYLDARPQPDPGLDASPNASPEPSVPAASEGADAMSGYRADIVVDRDATPEQPADASAIDANLARLDELAARRGAAIGVAGPLSPVLLDRVSVWAHGLAARGLVLAPLSAMPRPARAKPALQAQKR